MKWNHLNFNITFKNNWQLSIDVVRICVSVFLAFEWLHAIRKTGAEFNMPIKMIAERKAQFHNNLVLWKQDKKELNNFQYWICTLIEINVVKSVLAWLLSVYDYVLQVRLIHCQRTHGYFSLRVALPVRFFVTFFVLNLRYLLRTIILTIMSHVLVYITMSVSLNNDKRFSTVASAPRYVSSINIKVKKKHIQNLQRTT